MPKFYKGEWVHFVHFNQFPEKKRKKLSFGQEPLPPEVPREITPEEEKHRKRIISKGTYRSFKWLVREEGVEAAKEYISRCLQMGSPWITWDPMWSHPKYLVLELT